MFVDWASNSNAFKAEIYFVGAREYPHCRFGGRLDEVQDPQTGLIVTLRTFGEYALRVVDPAKLILNLVGTVDVTNNDAVTAWVTQQLLKATRTTVTTQLMSGAWPILGLSMHSPDIEVGAMGGANHELSDYGIAITRLGNLDINLLTAGSTLYLPVQVPGALAYVGDPHFAQGDGEVALTALEAFQREDSSFHPYTSKFDLRAGNKIGGTFTAAETRGLPSTRTGAPRAVASSRVPSVDPPSTTRTSTMSS